MKKIFSLLMVSLLCLSLAACGGGGERSTSTVDQPSEIGSAVSDSADESRDAGSSGSSEESPLPSEADESSDLEGEGAPEGASQVLNLYTWEGMFPPEVLAGYTEETGIEVNYVNFDTDENMLAKLQTEKGGTYDLIIADDYIIETAIDEGLVQKLDKSKIPNFDNINPLYQGQFFDPADEYTVPHGSGVQTIVYNPAMVDLDIKGYQDLFDPILADDIGMTANFRVINGIGLKIHGESYNTDSVPLIEEAGAYMLDLAPNVRLIKDDNLQDDLLSGEVNVAIMYTSQVTNAMIANPELEVVYPQEGLGFGIMGSFVPVNAPNADGAHAFLDYILRPDVGAACFEYLGYYCTNLAAEEHLNPEYLSFLTLPAQLNAADMEMIGNISPEALDAHEKAWIAFKTACGQ